ncbi:hypothetical protein SAMN05428969_1702 [Devosia sp. YR412]|uniref:hypothetical protein n=1 Tax=Devosia sp. YR412 TaxID=1881030 RepID=UPI0008AEE7D7|nr:hypothetical protein [Devosia sp. YR412]SEQ04827.1 hypothetical protein SAMN05428969_1702 [Devosia sp. YR412]
MSKIHKFPLSTFLLLTIVPAILVGAGLWYLSGLAPTCSTEIATRLTSPDGQFDLVTFSRSCGDGTGPNSQAALIPAGEDLPDDAASFASVAAETNLDPRWDGFGNIELTLPQGAEIYRQDETVAGIAVIYR